MATDYTNKEVAQTYAEGIKSDLLSLREKLLKVVGGVSGKSILDLGCGYGKYSIIFAQEGAEVVGVDISQEQIRLAKEKNPHKDIHYIVGEPQTELSNQEFDIVFMNIVVPDVEPKTLTNIFSYSAQSTRERFIFTILHPLYLCQADNSSLDAPVNFNPKNYFNNGSTYKAEAVTNEGSKMRFEETHYNLTFLSEKLIESGFYIKRLIESDPVPEEGQYFPLYLIFECVLKDK